MGAINGDKKLQKDGSKQFKRFVCQVQDGYPKQKKTVNDENWNRVWKGAEFAECEPHLSNTGAAGYDNMGMIAIIVNVIYIRFIVREIQAILIEKALYEVMYYNIKLCAPVRNYTMDVVAKCYRVSLDVIEK
ncbi:Hypothetical predicted protein [Octopus vulgaris]|uniref:Uncharacterized protein n=1 Tax=Octopus vulgaris TaxID=6645 RepID=A0AA36B7X1_OCTVU|nr:Hypothetical predicted protein [Octopus vulgaris]